MHTHMETRASLQYTFVYIFSTHAQFGFRAHTHTHVHVHNLGGAHQWVPSLHVECYGLLDSEIWLPIDNLFKEIMAMIMEFLECDMTTIFKDDKEIGINSGLDWNATVASKQGLISSFAALKYEIKFASSQSGQFGSLI